MISPKMRKAIFDPGMLIFRFFGWRIVELWPKYMSKMDLAGPKRAEMG